MKDGLKSISDPLYFDLDTRILGYTLGSGSEANWILYIIFGKNYEMDLEISMIFVIQIVSFKEKDSLQRNLWVVTYIKIEGK